MGCTYSQRSTDTTQLVNACLAAIHTTSPEHVSGEAVMSVAELLVEDEACVKMYELAAKACAAKRQWATAHQCYELSKQHERQEPRRLKLYRDQLLALDEGYSVFERWTRWRELRECVRISSLPARAAYENQAVGRLARIECEQGKWLWAIGVFVERGWWTLAALAWLATTHVEFAHADGFSEAWPKTFADQVDEYGVDVSWKKRVKRVSEAVFARMRDGVWRAAPPQQWEALLPLSMPDDYRDCVHVLTGVLDTEWSQFRPLPSEVCDGCRQAETATQMHTRRWIDGAEVVLYTTDANLTVEDALVDECVERLVPRSENARTIEWRSLNPGNHTKKYMGVVRFDRPLDARVHAELLKTMQEALSARASVSYHIVQKHTRHWLSPATEVPRR